MKLPIPRVLLTSCLFLAATSVALVPATSAQMYPSKPVTIIVPFPPGGALDTVTRIIQPRLTEFLGQPVIVENRAGAGGLIGSAQAAKAAPDGYTLLAVFDTHAVNQHLYKQAPDIFTAFEHMSLMVTTPHILVARADFAPNNLTELIALAKTKPGKLTYGSVGPGSSNHLGTLLLAQRAGIEMLHIPFKGGAPLVQAMLGKHVDVTFTFPAGVMAYLPDRLKPVAVGGRQRMSQLPEVPTVAETLAGFELVSWFGIVAPKGVPRDIFNRIHRDVVRALRAPEVKERLLALGYNVDASSPEEFSAFVRAESDKLGKVIRDHGVKIE